MPFIIQFFKVCLNVLAVPNNVIFCRCYVFTCIPKFFMYCSNFLLITSSAPVTTGTTSTFFINHILLTCCFNLSYFSIFSCSFTPTLFSPGMAMSSIVHFFSSFSITTLSGFQHLKVTSATKLFFAIKLPLVCN